MLSHVTTLTSLTQPFGTEGAKPKPWTLLSVFATPTKCKSTRDLLESLAHGPKRKHKYRLGVRMRRCRNLMLLRSDTPAQMANRIVKKSSIRDTPRAPCS